jgi:hypothetical protein
MPAAIRRARWSRHRGRERSHRSLIGRPELLGQLRLRPDVPASRLGRRLKRIEDQRGEQDFPGRQGRHVERPTGGCVRQRWQFAVTPGFQVHTGYRVGRRLRRAAGEEHDLPERGVLRVRETVGAHVAVVAGQVAGRDGEPALWDQEDEHAARTERPCETGQEGVLQAPVLVILGVRRVQVQAGEGAVSQADRERARGDHVVQPGTGCRGAPLVELDAVALGTERPGDRRRLAGAGAGVEESHGARAATGYGGEMSGNRRRHPGRRRIIARTGRGF